MGFAEALKQVGKLRRISVKVYKLEGSENVEFLDVDDAKFVVF
jgi:hypothetical protein